MDPAKEPTARPDLERERLVLPLATEEAVIGKLQRSNTVQIRSETVTREQTVSELLTSTNVVVERLPMDCFVDAVPPVREEGGVTILSVVEEVLVIERRLRLTEEVHIRRVQTTAPHNETVTLRTQRVVVTRSDPVISEPGGGMPAPATQAPTTSPTKLTGESA